MTRPEGFVGTPAFVFPYDEGPGIDEAVAYAEKIGLKREDLTQKWLQGWVFGRILTEAISRAGDDVTGETLKAAFETFNELDLGGIGAPLTFTPTRPRRHGQGPHLPGAERPLRGDHGLRGAQGEVGM